MYNICSNSTNFIKYKYCVNLIEHIINIQIFKFEFYNDLHWLLIVFLTKKKNIITSY